MATTEVDTDSDREEHGEAAGHGGDHPTEKQYILIALILGFVTAVEVGLYYTNLGVNLTNVMLGVLAIIKFVMVVGYFMHLKFDNPVVRRLFVAGLLLAIAVYVAYLLTMGVFIDPPHDATG